MWAVSSERHARPESIPMVIEPKNTKVSYEKGTVALPIAPQGRLAAAAPFTRKKLVLFPLLELKHESVCTTYVTPRPSSFNPRRA